MYGRVTYDNENVYLNGQRILGVKSFDGQMGFSRTPISALGAGYLGQALEGEVPKSYSFSKYVGSSEEDLLSLASSEITGVYKYKSSRNDFTQEWTAVRSRMSSYELSCQVGELPEASVSFEVVGAAGFSDKQVNNETEWSDEFNVIRPGDLIVSGENGFSNNRLQSFRYTITNPVSKGNLIGGEFVSFFRQNEPVEVVIKMDFDLDSLEDDLSDLPLCEKDFAATFIFNKCGNKIRAFSISGAELIDSSVNGEVGSNATFSATYRYYEDGIEQVIASNTL